MAGSKISASRRAEIKLATDAVIAAEQGDRVAQWLAFGGGDGPAHTDGFVGVATLNLKPETVEAIQQNEVRKRAVRLRPSTVRFS